MLDKGLIIFTAGTIYVFTAMGLIIASSLIIKKVFSNIKPAKEQFIGITEEHKPLKTDEFNGEEEAIIAAVTAYLVQPRVIEKFSLKEIWTKDNPWSLAGRRELMEDGGKKNDADV